MAKNKLIFGFFIVGLIMISFCAATPMTEEMFNNKIKDLRDKVVENEESIEWVRSVAYTKLVIDGTILIVLVGVFILLGILIKKKSEIHIGRKKDKIYSDKKERILSEVTKKEAELNKLKGDLKKSG